MMRSTSICLMSHHFHEMLSDPKFDIFYDASILILISIVAKTPAALAAENLMLTARAAGLGTCWIGFAQGWLGTPNGKALLKLPASYKPFAPIIVGHSKSQPEPVSRK
jgi:nitroreductase